MTALIAWPLRVALNGAVATQEDDTAAYCATELAQLIRTHRGERELVPLYGTSDPTFARLAEADLSASVANFGPPVVITDVVSRALSATKVDVEVAFIMSNEPATPVVAGRSRRRS